LTTQNNNERLAYRVSSRLPQDEFLKLSEKAILNRTSTSELVRQIIREALVGAPPRAVGHGQTAAEGRAVMPERPQSRWRLFGFEV